MRAVNYSALIALLLTGCGGGGDKETAVSANPPPANPPAAATPVPAPSPVVTPPPGLAPTPVVAPVDPKPVEPSPGGSPSQPVLAPQPAEGTYILGRVVKAAMASGDESYSKAYEVDPMTGRPDGAKDEISLMLSQGASVWFQQTIPRSFRCPGCETPNVHPYPHSSVAFTTGYSDEGYFLLKRGMTAGTVGNEVRTALVRRDGDFEIRDDFKFILNTTSAEWLGVEGQPYFLQLQISTYTPSNTVFKLCLHEYFPGVRRLACTLHDKDSGALKGVQVLDDSAGLGSREYRTLD